jgi:Ca2+-binding RTX toxin-like protein
VRRVAVIGCALALALPAHALASTLSRSGNTLVYTAAPGEANDISISVTPDGYSVENFGSDILTVDSSLGGCQSTCPNPGLTDVSVDLGDGNDKYTGATTVPETINGGDGDDQIFASHATMHGGPGNDSLKSGVGPNFLDGGPGDDLLDPFSGDTVDCGGGGNDRFVDQAPPGLKLLNCGSGPTVTARIPHIKLRSFLRGGLKISLSCDTPCAIQWFMQGADRRTKLRVHTGCGCLARHFFRHDADGTLALAPPGPQAFPVRVLGTATKKALGRARSIKVRLLVTAQDSLGVQRRIGRVFSVKR